MPLISFPPHAFDIVEHYAVLCCDRIVPFSFIPAKEMGKTAIQSRIDCPAT